MFRVRAVDVQFSEVLPHAWTELKRPSQSARTLLEQICRAHPQKSLPALRDIRAHALLSPTLTNLMVFDQATVLLYNRLQWNQTDPTYYRTSLTNLKVTGPQIVCICEEEVLQVQVRTGVSNSQASIT